MNEKSLVSVWCGKTQSGQNGLVFHDSVAFKIGNGSNNVSFKFDYRPSSFVLMVTSVQ